MGSAAGAGHRWAFVRRARTARALRRAEGTGALARVAASKLRLGTMLVFECRPDVAPPAVAPAVDAVFAYLSPGDVDAYVAHRGPDVGRERALARLRSGDRCLVAWRGDRVAASRWVVAGALVEDTYAFAFPLAKEHAYTYDAWTSESERGSRLGPAVLSRLGADLRDEGCTRVVSLVYALNEPGLRLMERCGHRRAGWVAYRGGRALWLGAGRPRRAISAAAARDGRGERAGVAPSGAGHPDWPGDAAAAD